MTIKKYWLRLLRIQSGNIRKKKKKRFSVSKSGNSQVIERQIIANYTDNRLNISVIFQEKQNCHNLLSHIIKNKKILGF